MSAGNHVSITGNMTRDPETKFTQGGTAVTTFGLAHNRKWRDRVTQESHEEVGYFDVTVWGKVGENVAASLGKGTKVVVTGRLSYRAWETKDGDKRSKVEIVAEEVSPSLVFATAAVTKTLRDEDGGGSSSGGGRRGGGGRAVVEDDDDPDDEPF